MQGNNPIRPPVPGDGTRLDVKHIFPTLQGEGPYAGRPAVFVRLGGCNLACRFCDTEFEDYVSMPLAAVIAQVKALSLSEGRRTHALAVITGGEPLRQNIGPLCEALQREGFTVQIETNGTLYRALPPGVEIVCSPKNTGAGYFPLRGDLLPRLTALKFLVSKHRPDYRLVPEVGQSAYRIPVYVQPMDEHDDVLNRENRAYAVALARANGYVLSLQTHKLLGID